MSPSLHKRGLAKFGGGTPSTAPQSQEGSLASTLMGTCNDQIPWGGGGFEVAEWQL